MTGLSIPTHCITCSTEMRAGRSKPDGRTARAGLGMCTRCYSEYRRRNKDVPTQKRTDWSQEHFCTTCDKKMRKPGTTVEDTVIAGTRGCCRRCSNIRNQRARGVQPRKYVKSDEYGKWCTACFRYFRYDSNSFNKGVGLNNLIAACKRCTTIKKHGITFKQFSDMLEAQGGVCAICKTSSLDTVRGFHIDHDHACCPKTQSCGKCIRGILCGRCNPAIGLLKEDAEIIKNALIYIAKTRVDEG